ncbi:MAG: hypothetical protein IJX16_04465 [Clostridia bacterium]|nr:hypothetical protein [Clostridia bacterium]
MELKKRKYKKAEVETYIDGIKAEYELKFIEQRNKIRELIKDNNDLRTKLEVHVEREALVLSALTRAESTAKEIEKNAELQYELEVKRIKNFAEKWNGYFKELKEKYPLYPVTKKALAVKDKLDSMVDENKSPKKIVEELDVAIDGKKPKFNPKSKIKDYIASTSDNGFNMDEVLNPGALKLEDICKELGLIEEND